MRATVAIAATIRPQANTGAPPMEGMEKMARRRYQNPTPVRRGRWWTVLVWKDHFIDGKQVRRRERLRIAPASKGEREAARIVAEVLRPMNQGLETIGSATNFKHFVDNVYVPLIMSTLATTTKDRYEGVLDNYLIPSFGALCLRDVTPMSVQRYFSDLASKTKLQHESRDKVRDVLSSVLNAARQYNLLITNPVEGVRMPPDRRGKKRSKPYLSPELFDRLLVEIQEPYASMVFVAIYTGLRVSELAGLRWNDLGDNTITIDERYCRGDWGSPKSESSNATIPVKQCVVERIHRLKLLTVHVRAGPAVRKYKVVKADGPNDLIFQSVRDGKPIRDNNILVRFIKPAGRKLGLDWVNWRCLRTSHATWLKIAGADVKDAQAQMRHSRASTTLDIYQQFVPESQRRVVDRLGSATKMVQ